MEQLLSSPVQIAKPHALPFRVIFEEHRRRRRQDLLRNAATFLLPTDAEPLEEFAEQALIAHIHRQEQAYEKLAEANAAIEAGDFSTPTNITKDDPGLSAYAPTPPDVDSLLKECEKADEPLKQILHSMEAS